MMQPLAVMFILPFHWSFHLKILFYFSIVLLFRLTCLSFSFVYRLFNCFLDRQCLIFPDIVKI